MNTEHLLTGTFIAMGIASSVDYSRLKPIDDNTLTYALLAFYHLAKATVCFWLAIGLLTIKH